MVQAQHTSSYSFNSNESGSETTNLYQGLLLSGANREVVQKKLFEMANYYINADKTNAPVHKINNGDNKLSLQTWRLKYKHQSYDPQPPMMLDQEDRLHVYVTKAHIPDLTVT